jgi:hypothetical protein
MSPLPEPDVTIVELPPPEQDDPYVLSGLGVVSPSFFDDLFDFDWTHSDVDRIVRDAVERSRIQSILRRHYRVLVLYFRQFAGKTALSTASSQCIGSDFLQIPNRLSLLDDLNVQCVDPVKYGLTETPLRREGLVTLITHAAKMVAAHSVNTAQFRLFAVDGVDMSEAVRSLMADHLVVYAQLQDAAHFRDVFLLDHHDRQGRRLRHLLTTHETSLSSLFFGAIATTAISSSSTGPTNRVRVPSDSYRVGRLAAPQATTMNFDSFVSVLKTLGVIPSKATRRQRPARDSDTASTSPTKAVVTLDENRAMRIFQQCLDLHAELSSGTAREPQLTYPQFVEALLRVTLILNETTICHGGLDICPGQHTSDRCCCRTHPPIYDLSAFDNAIEAVFARIQSHRLLRQATKRSNLKMASVRSLLQATRVPAQDHQALMVEPDENVTPPTAW